MASTKIGFGLVCAAMTMVACGGSSGSSNESTTPAEEQQANAPTVQQVLVPPPPAPPTPARIRVIHASPDAALAQAAVFADGNSAALIESVAYKALANVEVLPGTHQVAVRAAGAAADAPASVQVTTPSFTEGVPYTIVVHGISGTPNALALAAAADDTAPSAVGEMVGARFFHAIAGAGAVDVCVPGARARDAGTPVHGNVAFGAFGAAAGENARGQWASVQTGREVRLQLRAANATRPCSGAVIGTAPVTLEAGVAVTFVAVGRQGAGRRDPGVAKELLVCPSGAAECRVVALSTR